MILQFIGTDGSMRLTKYKTYNVKIYSRDGYLWVSIPRFEFRHMIFGTWKCPYTSPQTLAENWRVLK